MPDFNPGDRATRKSNPPRLPPETLSDPQTGGGWPPLGSSQLPGKIGRFVVRRLLGEGAFARVYLAFDPELEREVAIKVPKAEELTPEFRDSFLRENRLAAIVNHTNICPIFEVGTDGGVPYIVMRVVSDTLAGLLRRMSGPMPPRGALAIARKLALGLTAAHAQKIVHRDLKPANVLYDEASREILLADFGLARFVDRASEASNGVPKGTPAYMAPEQARGLASQVGPLSDVYALGVILFEMLTGQVPFSGSIWEVMRDHCEVAPPPPSALRPGLDPRLDAVVLKALEKHPADRYPSAKAFATALSDYLRTTEQEGAAPSGEQSALKKSTVRPPGPPPLPASAPKAVPRAAPVQPPEPRRPAPPPLPRDDDREPSRRRPRRGREDRDEDRKAGGGASARTKLFLALGGLALFACAALGVGLSTGLIGGSKNEDPQADRKPEPSESARYTPPATPPAESKSSGPPPKSKEPEPKSKEAPKPPEPKKEPTPVKKDPPKPDPVAQAKADLKQADAYFYGIGAARDFVKAREYYGKAAAQGLPEAQFALAEMYYKGSGGAIDYDKARDWYERAAQQGKAAAQNSLGAMHEKGLGGPVDYAKAKQWYERAAGQGLAEAQNSLGDIYFFGRGVPRDYAEARDWYLRAAKQGHAAAQFNYGEIYYTGRGVEKDYAIAKTWYEKSAAQGYGEAVAGLGDLYYSGLGVARDYVKAADYYQKGADLGNSHAQVNLGYLYKTGQGVARDAALAKSWYEKAAAQGNAVAQSNLGWLYFDGDAVARDYAKAKDYFEKAAEKDNERAQYGLGLLYENGYGVKADADAALLWYGKSAAKNYDLAKTALKRLSGPKK